MIGSVIGSVIKLVIRPVIRLVIGTGSEYNNKPDWGGVVGLIILKSLGVSGI